MKKVLILPWLFFIASCTQAPFVDMRREAGKPYTIGESTSDVVAVCFNKYSTHSSEIIRMAQEECKKTGREAKFKDINRWSCRVLLPHRVYFECAEPPKEEFTVSGSPAPLGKDKTTDPIERLPPVERPAR